MMYSDRDGELKLTGTHLEKGAFEFFVNSSLFAIKGASSLAQVLRTASVRSLGLGYSILPKASTDDWLELFQVLPGLSILTLSCDGVSRFPRKPERTRLVIEALGKVGTRRGGLVCPELEQLEVRGFF